MLPRAVFTLLLLPLLAGCARLPWSWPVSPPPRIAEDAIASDVAWLADDERQGRGLGSEGLARSADHIAEAFARAGLEPGAPQGGWLQRFETTVRIDAGVAELSVDDTPLERGADFEPFLGSADGDVSGEIVFAGHGISDSASGWDDYAGLDVRGRVVLLLEDRPEGVSLGGGHGAHLGPAYKRANAHKHGAAAVLLAPAVDGADALGGRVRDQSARPGAAPGKLPALGISRDAARHLLARAGLDLAALQRSMTSSSAPASRLLGIEARVHVVVERARGEVSNVVGLLRGSERPHEAVVIGAHYDHLGLGHFDTMAPDRRGEVHNGADDNASGTAALIALARSFATGPAPGRSIVFVAFTAEEVGLLGSWHYARNPAVPLEDTVAMLNMDMVGRLRDDQVTVFGVRSSPVWRTLMARTSAGLELHVTYVEDDIGPSDHTSFALRGVPALMFFTGSHTDYHTPDDDVADVNVPGIARVAALVGRTARTLADADVRVPARKAGSARPAPASAQRGYGAYLGTIPAFAGEPVAGVRLQGVREGSPADRAGLQADDVLVSFDGAPVANLEEFAALLFRARPGAEVEIGYRRQGDRHTTRATLGTRR